MQGPDGPKRKEFYQPLVDRLREVSFTTRQNATSAWIQTFTSDVPGLTYNADVGNNPRVFLSMGDRNSKKQVFDALRQDAKHLQRMEKQLGIEKDPRTRLVWKTSQGNIAVSIDKSDNNLTEEVRKWMYEYLIKFEEVFDACVKEIVSNLSSDAE